MHSNRDFCKPIRGKSCIFQGYWIGLILEKKIPVQEKSRMAVHKAREKEGITVLLKSVLPPREMRISSWDFCLRRNKQQFSIQKRVQRTRTLMQIHCFTDILLINYSSTFTNVLIWDLKRQCFCSVSSFAMIVLGLACKFPLNIYAKPTCCNDNQSSRKFFITFI